MKALLVVFAFVSSSAWAGKAERDYRASDVEPAQKAAESAFKTGCGCSLSINVKWDEFSTKNQLGEARHILNSVTDNAPKYCTDTAAKAAVCKMKTLEVKMDKTVAFTFTGSKGTATTDGQAFANFDMMSKELDK